jgi:hypothetical protein
MFVRCFASVGNFIYISAVDLFSLITLDSFSYSYSLIEPKDLMGRIFVGGDEKLEYLNVYLCPFHTQKETRKKNGLDEFDCNDGCVLYQV